MRYEVNAVMPMGGLAHKTWTHQSAKRKGCCSVCLVDFVDRPMLCDLVWSHTNLLVGLRPGDSNWRQDLSPASSSMRPTQQALLELAAMSYYFKHTYRTRSLRTKLNPTNKTLCPSGLRGWTQVPLARAAWAQIPQVSFVCSLFSGQCPR